MGLSDVLAFAFVAALLTVTPGPNGFLIARTVPTSGKFAGFANIFGIATAFYVHGALSIFGISILLLRSAELFFVFKMIGAAYLCWIGIKALRDAYKKDQSTALQAPARNVRTLSRAFGEGFLTNMLNPKVSMFYLAAFPQFLPPEGATALDAGSLVVIHSLIVMLWFSAIVVFFSRLGASAGAARFTRWIKGLTGVVFIGFGLKLATYRP